VGAEDRRRGRGAGIGAGGGGVRIKGGRRRMGERGRVEDRERQGGEGWGG